MHIKPSGEIRTDILKEEQKNGTIYVYERKTKYDPEKKRNVYLSKKLIGKIPAGHSTDEPPTATRPKRKPSNTVDQSKVIASSESTGMIDILLHFLKTSGVKAELNKAIIDNKGMALKVQTAALYVAATSGNTWPGLFNWTTKYLNQLPYFSNAISEDMAHDMFKYLGENESIKQSIFKQRAEALPDEELIALDSSTYVIESNTGEIRFVRMSLHKDKTIEPLYKVVELYAIKMRRSIAYAIIPGNISDSATVPNVLKQLDYLNLRNLELISDGGYCTEENIARMFECDQSFITHIEADVSWVYNIIEENRDTILYGGEIIRFDPLFSGFKKVLTHTFTYIDKETEEEHSVTREVNVLIYYSSTLAAKNDANLRETYSEYQEALLDNIVLGEKKDTVEKFCKKYMVIHKDKDGNIDKITRNGKNWKKAMKCNGMLVLVADKESDLNSGLEKYRSRETIDEDIKGMKLDAKAKITRKHGEETIDGQFLVKFEGHSILNSFQSKLKSIFHSLAIPSGEYPHDRSENMKIERELRHWISKNSKHNILDWFDGIKTTTAVNGEKIYQWRTEYTNRDILLLKKLGILESIESKDSQ